MTLTRITYKAGHQPERKDGDAWFRLRRGPLCLAADPVAVLREPRQEQAPRRSPQTCQVTPFVVFLLSFFRFRQPISACSEQT